MLSNESSFYPVKTWQGYVMVSASLLPPSASSDEGTGLYSQNITDANEMATLMRHSTNQTNAGMSGNGVPMIGTESSSPAYFQDCNHSREDNSDIDAEICNSPLFSDTDLVPPGFYDDEPMLAVSALTRLSCVHNGSSVMASSDDQMAGSLETVPPIPNITPSSDTWNANTCIAENNQVTPSYMSAEAIAARKVLLNCYALTSRRTVAKTNLNRRRALLSPFPVGDHSPSEGS